MSDMKKKSVSCKPKSHSDAFVNLEVMTLDAFKLWSDAALKVFLAMRKKPNEGPSDVLAARFVL